MIRILLTACAFFLALTTHAQISSIAAGSWQNPGNWDCGCIPDDLSAQEIFVNHAMTIDADQNVNQVRIGATGSITINAGFTLFFVEDFVNTPLTIASGGSITNNGTLDFSNVFFTPSTVDGTITSSSTINLFDPSLLVFNANSRYIHNWTTGGDIPIVTWQEDAICEIRGLTAANPIPPNNLNQEFEDLVWNTTALGTTTGPAIFSLAGALTTMHGNLRFASTNNKAVYLASDGGAGYTIQVDENFVFDGGVVFLTRAQTTNSEIDVDGNFTMSAGNLSMALGNSNIIDLKIKGNVTKTAGTMTAGTGTGVKRMTFNGDGSSDQTYSVNAQASGMAYLVDVGAVLNLGTGAIVTSGTTGSFTASGTVKLGSTSATGAVAGNIPITSRTFNSGSTVIYNNATNTQQFLGAAHPATAGVATIIQNSGGVAVASAISTATIGGNLTLTSGNLIVGAGKTIVLNGSFTPGSNSINVTSTSNITVGSSATAFGTLKTSGSTTINNLTIARPGLPITIGNSLTINGTFSQDASSVDFSSTTLTIGNNYTVTSGSLIGNSAATLIITGLGTVGTVPLSGTLGTLTIDQPSGVVNTTSITVSTALNILTGTYSGAGTVTLGSGATLTRRDGSLTKTLTASNYNLTYTNTAPITTGAELVTSPTTALQTLRVNSTNTVQLNAALTNVTINSNLDLNAGIFDSNSKGIILKGNLISNATGTLTSSLLTFAGNSTISGGVALTLGNIFLNSGATLNLGSATTIDFMGNIDHTSGGTMVAGTSTVRFVGTSTINCTSTSIPNFNNLEILSGGSMAISCVSGCGVAPNQYGIQVGGDWDTNNTGVTFTPNTSRVILNGASQGLDTAPGQQFYGLQMVGTGTITLQDPLDVRNNFILGPTATLNTGSNRAMFIGGSFFANGTFVPNSGTVTFNGSGPQTIDQTSGSNTTTFFDIVINKGGGTFAIEKNVTLTNSLAINSGTTIDFDGAGGTDVFTIASTQTTTGVVLPVNAGAVLNGTVHAQRYMDGEGQIYRYISSPVGPVSPDATGPRVYDLQGEIPITGTFTGDSFNGPCAGCAPCTGCTASSKQSMFIYDETLTANNLDKRYSDFPVNANTEQMTPGKGYAVFVRQASLSTTIDLRGKLTSGNVTLPVTYSGATLNDGWNLVGNPYASPIDWDLSGTQWTRNNVDVTIYTTDNGSGGVYATYNRSTHTGTNNGSRYIATGQGFWVRTTGAAPSLIVTEAAKANQQPEFFRVGDPDNTVRILLSKGNLNDESMLHFGFDGSTAAFDPSIDSYKLTNLTAVDLYTVSSDNKPLTINAMSGQACGTEVKLGMYHPVVGAYRIGFPSMTFTDPLNVYLQDQFTGTSQLITPAANTYDFQVTSDPNSSVEGRLKLVFSAITVNTALDFTSSDICSGADATLTIPSSQVNLGYTAMINGQPVSSQVLGTGGDISIIIPKDKLTAGVNQIRVQATANSCGVINVLLAKTLPVEVQNIPVITSVTSATNCGPGQIDLKASSSSTNGKFHWFDAADAVTPIPGQEGSTYTTPYLIKTKTYYVSPVTSAGCEGSRTQVAATIVNFDPATITEDAGMLKSNYTDGNQWYLNGQAINGATNQTIVPQQSGTYKLVVSVGGNCSTSVERIFAVTAIEPLPGHMTLYPNPTSGQFLLEVTTDNDVLAEVVNVMGVVVQDQFSDSRSSRKKMSFNVQDQADGMYILRIQDGSKIYNTRIIKKK